MLLLLIAGIFAGSENENVADEIIYADNFVGVGMRALAMGGTHIALAQDYSAAYYNPALLGFVFGNEVSGMISIRNGNSTTTINNGPEKTSDFSAVKLNNLSGVISARAKRGGVAVAVGYYRYQSFDYSNYFVGVRSDDNSITSLETSDGGMGSFYLAAGGQVLEYISLGATMEAITGAQNYTWNSTISGFVDSSIVDTILPATDSIFSDKITEDVSGVTGRFGIAISPNKYFTWGALVKFPSLLKIKQEWVQKTTIERTDDTREEIEYYQFEDNIDITMPFQFGTGLALKSPIVNVSTDILYSDWRQIRYHKPAYFIQENPYIPDSYRAVLSFGAGLEFTLPIKFLPTRIRGGYRYDPIPYKPLNIEKERQFFTTGIAFLIEKSILLEGAAVFSNWKRSYSTSRGNDISERYEITDIYIGLSYRF